jgi:hypothetical protein
MFSVDFSFQVCLQSHAACSSLSLGKTSDFNISSVFWKTEAPFHLKIISVVQKWHPHFRVS